MGTNILPCHLLAYTHGLISGPNRRLSSWWADAFNRQSIYSGSQLQEHQQQQLSTQDSWSLLRRHQQMLLKSHIKTKSGSRVVTLYVGRVNIAHRNQRVICQQLQRLLRYTTVRVLPHIHYNIPPNERPNTVESQTEHISTRQSSQTRNNLKNSV